MQVRIVDAVKVHRLKKRANRLAHQNVHDSRLMGITIHDVLTELELWEDERSDVSGNHNDTVATKPNGTSQKTGR